MLWTDLEGTRLVALLIIAFGIQTAVLGTSLLMLSGEDDNPFKEDGQLIAWGKCAGLVAGVTLILMFPLGGLVAIGGWFVGVMMLFERTLSQTFMLFLANIVISYGLIWLLMQVLV